MSLEKLITTYQPAIEETLSETISRVNGSRLEELHKMMAYHLGLMGEGAGPYATGKRIRPLLVLLTSQASGSNWHKSLPAAVAVELVHNFSLIHDDIEDNSPLRRGRPTLWVKWGIPLAINTGDAMFTLAHLKMLDLEENTNPRITLDAVNILQNTCLHLTQGQHLDISYEDERVLSVEAYWPMIQGKTAALISACTEIGALISDVDESTRKEYKIFGRDLWGDSVKIGKSIDSDLVTRKKSLPILYGLTQNRDFSKRWLSGSITPDEVPELASYLKSEGAFDYAQNIANRLTDSAITALNRAQPQGEAGRALTELAHNLLQREI